MKINTLIALIIVMLLGSKGSYAKPIYRNANDSIFYVMEGYLNLSGYIYSCVSKKNSDYETKVFKFFCSTDNAVQDGKLSINFFDNSSGILILHSDFKELIKNIPTSQFILAMLNKTSLDKLELLKTISLKNGNKVNVFKSEIRFKVAFFDSQVFRAIFWVPKELKLPSSGYIKILFPSS